MKHGSPTEKDLMLMADEQVLKKAIIMYPKKKKQLIDHLNLHKEGGKVTLYEYEIKYLIQLLEKGESV